MGEKIAVREHPDQSKFPLDISPVVRYESYTADEIEEMLAELWERWERGDDMSDTLYRPIDEFW